MQMQSELAKCKKFPNTHSPHPLLRLSLSPSLPLTRFPAFTANSRQNPIFRCILAPHTSFALLNFLSAPCSFPSPPPPQRQRRRSRDAAGVTGHDDTAAAALSTKCANTSLSSSSVLSSASLNTPGSGGGPAPAPSPSGPRRRSRSRSAASRFSLTRPCRLTWCAARVET